MSVFDFLFPVLMAANSHERVKRQKANDRMRQEMKEDLGRMQSLDEYLRDNYTDINIELDDGCMPENEFYKLSQNLPSYDKKEKWTVKTVDEQYSNMTLMRKRLALAKHGKLLTRDAFTCSVTDPFWDAKRYLGRERYDYRGQIFHELMIEWEKMMHEHGFEFDLYVCNKYDVDNIFSPNTAIRNGEKVLARNTKYMAGNVYIWSYHHIFLPR